jgi:ribose 5-phosphate isomerase A
MAPPDPNPSSRFKQIAAETAVSKLHDGMIIGLGSGSTAALAVAAIGKRVQQGLRIIGVPTSEKTAAEARLLNIPLSSLEEQSSIDVTIDGADEVQPGTLHLIKGLGGNLLREKIVALASSRLIIVIDESKLVDQLGSRAPIPVEVVRFGWRTTAKRIESHGLQPTLRIASDGNPYLTDGGNWILDCAASPISDPANLQAKLDSTVGVVEHGLFLGIAHQIVVAGPEGARTLDRNS